MSALGVAERDPQGNFLGIVGSDCGEHRTVGDYRAWCHADSMWCYPGDPCYGCAAPITSARIESLVAENLALQTRLAAALQVIEDVRKLALHLEADAEQVAGMLAQETKWGRIPNVAMQEAYNADAVAKRQAARRIRAITDKETT